MTVRDMTRVAEQKVESRVERVLRERGLGIQIAENDIVEDFLTNYVL